MTDKTKQPEDSRHITLVLGGTGKTGRRIVEGLKARGVETRIGSRSSSPSFDWNDTSNWQTVLDGVGTIYINYAPDLAIPGATNSIRELVDLAVSCGVRRLVLLSGRGEKEAQACEQIVQTSSIEWTIIRSSWFMQNFSEGQFLAMVQEGNIALPASNVPEPFIDVNDIAEVAVAALTEAGHAYELYEVTGPRLMTFSEVALEISEVVDHDVKFSQLSKEVFSRDIIDSGAPAEIAWLLNYLFETVLDGRNAYLCDGVQRALGREPADFRVFASRIAARGHWNRNEVEAIA